jgi:hypothetical protein
VINIKINELTFWTRKFTSIKFENPVVAIFFGPVAALAIVIWAQYFVAW